MNFKKKSGVVVAVTLTMLFCMGAIVAGAHPAITGIEKKASSQNAVFHSEPIMLNNTEYTYLTELQLGNSKSERILFKIDTTKVFLYLYIEDYSEPIDIKVFYDCSDKMVSSKLGATFHQDSISGIFIDKGSGTYSVELGRSNPNSSNRVIVYGLATDNFFDYEKITLPNTEYQLSMGNSGVNPIETGIPLIRGNDFSFEIPYIEAGKTVLLGSIELEPNNYYSPSLISAERGQGLFIGLSDLPSVESIGDTPWYGFTSGDFTDLRWTSDIEKIAYVYVGSFPLPHGTDLTNVAGRIIRNATYDNGNSQ